MKYLVGFLFALGIGIIIQFLNEYVLQFVITRFMMGWMCCMGYNYGAEYYESNIKK